MKKLIFIPFLLLLFITGCDDSGVLLKNEISKESIEYINNNNILNTNEKIVAYYDVTIMLNNTESAILTDKRVIYHKDKNNHSIPFEKIKNVEHKTEILIGDIIVIESLSGDFLKIEIAPMNGGEVFLDLLNKKLNK